jgi:dissimilatory sulfite reductase (desulfoviridin) alpha/beta subunit
MDRTDLIQRVEVETERIAHSSVLHAPQYRVRPCGGAAGCPRALIAVRDVAEEVARRIIASGFPEFLAQGMAGRPILSHHRFQAAVAGCPNACSQPQICDFGIIGTTEVRTDATLCDACLGCVAACREGAMRLRHGEPRMIADRCIECGDCARACLTGALALGRRGYLVLAGGKLGRRPRLADTVARVDAPNTALQKLDRALGTLLRSRPGARLGDIMERRESPRLADTAVAEINDQEDH